MNLNASRDDAGYSLLHEASLRGRMPNVVFEMGDAKRRWTMGISVVPPRTVFHELSTGFREVEAGDTGRRVEPGVQEHLVDDEPHEQRLDHLQGGDGQGTEDDGADRVPV